MFLKRLATSSSIESESTHSRPAATGTSTLHQPPVEIPPLVEAECSRDSISAEEVEKNAWDNYENEKNTPAAADEVDEMTDCEYDDECNYNEYVYVLTIDNEPCFYFKYKCRALKYMRRRARELCLPLDAFSMTYKLVRHNSEDSLDIVKRLNNILITYDQVVHSFKIKRVYKKKNL
jgi:hypothetical protein